MKKPKVVIYDNDGMICDSKRFSDTYTKEFGVEMTVIEKFFDGPFKYCLIGRADLKEELGKVLKEWKWTGTAEELLGYWFAVGAELDEKMLPTIGKLKEQGVMVCLATNQEKYRTAFLVEKFGYDTLFDEIFASYTLGAYKHNEKGLAKTFEILQEKYGVIDKEEVMYWDDREGNVEAIRTFGMDGHHFKNYEDFRSVLSGGGLTV